MLSGDVWRLLRPWFHFHLKYDQMFFSAILWIFDFDSIATYWLRSSCSSACWERFNKNTNRQNFFHKVSIRMWTDQVFKEAVCSPVWRRVRRSPPRSQSPASAGSAPSSRCTAPAGWSWRRSGETPSSRSRSAPSPRRRSDAPLSPGRPGLKKIKLIIPTDRRLFRNNKHRSSFCSLFFMMFDLTTGRCSSVVGRRTDVLWGLNFPKNKFV